MSTFKVGNTVFIKSKYDPNKTGHNYRGGFITDMLYDYGGKSATVREIKYDPLWGRHRAHSLVPDDGYVYLLDIDNEIYGWTSAMFQINRDIEII